jgi:hypothetical protein
VGKDDKVQEDKAKAEEVRRQAAADFELIRKAEAVLAELDRNLGLEDRHADVLAALRIRIEGVPRKSLEELMSAAGDIRGKRGELDERLKAEENKSKGDLGDLMAREPKKKKSLDDLLGG